MTLKCSCKFISVVKIGNSDDENEDNILVPSLTELESEKEKKFAISDGATESIFSREWSSLLVSCFKDKPFDMVNLPSTINAISETWYSNISSIDLPWYAQEKLEIGAFATFLGLKLDLKDQVFEAVSIGDCTLFQIRNNEFLKSFPIEKYEEFGNTPALFSINPKYQTNFEETVKYLKVNVESGDLLILSSDAIAMWIFNRLNNGEKPWLNLEILLSCVKYVNDFTCWVYDKIREYKIKNDDISLILINIE